MECADRSSPQKDYFPRFLPLGRLVFSRMTSPPFPTHFSPVIPFVLSFEPVSQHWRFSRYLNVSLPSPWRIPFLSQSSSCLPVRFRQQSGSLRGISLFFVLTWFEAAALVARFNKKILLFISLFSSTRSLFSRPGFFGNPPPQNTPPPPQCLTFPPDNKESSTYRSSLNPDRVELSLFCPPSPHFWFDFPQS